MPQFASAVLTAPSAVFPCIRNPDYSLCLLSYSLKSLPAHCVQQEDKETS
ncbi:MAG: hypothetical protein U9P36_14845 [Thermodesulfobacteriota bacterium]|nr:hypothetical protein [Thermodesulfobacteriota bacterium]